MTDTKTLYINRLIVTLDVLQSLAKLIFREYRAIELDSSTSNLEFTVETEDKLTYSGSNLDFFNDAAVFGNKRLVSLHFSFSDVKTHKTIDLYLCHDSDDDRNKIVFTGHEPWLGQMLQLFEVTLKSFPRPTLVFKRFGTPLLAILTLGIGNLILLFSKFVAPESLNDALPFGSLSVFRVYSIKYIFAALFGYFPALVIVEKLQPMWPSVIFNIGTDIKITSSYRWIWGLIAFIFGILPFLSILIYDIAQAY